MIAEPVARLDRRHRRRQETVEQVLDVAVAVMAEQGVAGLSLGEVARRMGIRPPSLYVYFDSKNALYDAIFMPRAVGFSSRLRQHRVSSHLSLTTTGRRGRSRRRSPA
jgi:AcrR family transcriptional regulator